MYPSMYIYHVPPTLIPMWYLYLEALWIIRWYAKDSPICPRTIPPPSDYSHHPKNPPREGNSWEGGHGSSSKDQGKRGLTCSLGVHDAKRTTRDSFGEGGFVWYVLTKTVLFSTECTCERSW